MGRGFSRDIKNAFEEFTFRRISRRAFVCSRRLYAKTRNLLHEWGICMREMRASKASAGSDSSSDRRRSYRVQITMPVLVRGKNGEVPFTEEGLTVSVNAHGCMVRLAAKLVRGQELAIVNPKTVEELPCIVTFIGQKDSGKTEVGLEFIEPSPLFWRITFPSADWDPSERKNHTTPSTRALPKR